MALLTYIDDTREEVANASQSDAIMKIHERVQQVKSNEEIGVKYMQAWEEKIYDKMEAREEGLTEGRAEGIAKNMIDTVTNMFNNHLSEETISQYLNKPLEEIHFIYTLLQENPDADLDALVELYLGKETVII